MNNTIRRNASWKPLLQLGLCLTVVCSPAFANPPTETPAPSLVPAWLQGWFGGKPTTETPLDARTVSEKPVSGVTPVKPTLAKPGAVIETSRGSIVIALYPSEAPKTVANFQKLVREGFYDTPGMVFHRVVPGFVVQTGDPTGTGYGGSKTRIPLEVKNELKHDALGVVAMARGASPNSASSQFYITLKHQPALDGKYAIFGQVIKGYDALKSIQRGDRVYSIALKDVTNVVPELNPDAETRMEKIFGRRQK